MNRNFVLYQSAYFLMMAAKFIKHIDEKFADELLNKAEEYKNEIKVDPKLEKEVEDYERKIQEGL